MNRNPENMSAVEESKGQCDNIASSAYTKRDPKLHAVSSQSHSAANIVLRFVFQAKTSEQEEFKIYY